MSSLAFHNNTFDMNNTWYNSHKEILEKVAIELGCADKIDELSERLLGPKHKMKKHKDLNAPKKPKTGFMHFCDEFRPEVNKKNPELKLGGVMKELGKMWGECSDEDKEKCISKINNKLLYKDDDHLSYEGAFYISQLWETKDYFPFKN